MKISLYLLTDNNAKGPAGVDITCGALLRMLKVEWGMLNSHSSSFSLAGGRRACPALKPDAADQVLLKNRAGFAAFSKGRTFHRCLEQDRCAGDREAGTGGGHPVDRVHGQCGHTAGWRGLTVGDAGITRRLSETYSADYLTCPQDSPGVFSLSEGLRPSRCRRAIRAGRTHGPCVPTAGVAVAFGYGFYGSSRRGLRRDMPGGAYLF